MTPWSNILEEAMTYLMSLQETGELFVQGDV